jgi:hypothetical protein
MDAFPEGRSEADDTSVDFLHALRDSWKEIAISLNRTLFLTLGLVVVFELLAQGQEGELNLGIITVKDTAVIQKFLTVAVAYLYLELVVLTIRQEDTHTAHTQLMKRIQPNIESNDLDLLLQPPARTLFTGGPAPRKSNALRYESLLDAILYTLIYPVLLMPIAFEVHAFYVLFRRFHSSDILVWVCLVLQP